MLFFSRDKLDKNKNTAPSLFPSSPRALSHLESVGQAMGLMPRQEKVL